MILIPEEEANTARGRSILRTKKVVIRGDDGEPETLLGITEDITEQKRNQASLLVSAKMASLGEMAAGIAHEINNPLAIISGKAGLALRRISEPEIDLKKLEGDLLKINENVSRISKIVRSLKSFSRNSELDPLVLVEIGSLVEDSLEFLREKFKILISILD